MSAARQAAEAAFAAPELRPPQPGEVQITVRRARGAEIPQSEPGLKPERQATPCSSDAPLAAKGPRVFRIETLQTPRSQEAPAAVNTLAHEDALRDHPPKPPTTSKRRRRATHMQPGPVLHVVHTLAVRSEPEPEPEPTRPRLDLMAAELAQIGKVLDQAKHAESLQFIAPGFGRVWDRLGRRVQQLQHDIHMQTRRGDEQLQQYLSMRLTLQEIQRQNYI
jgi:hypothetical protein